MRIVSMSSLCLACLAGLSMGQEDVKKAEQSLQGTWKLTAAEVGGKAVGEEEATWTVKGEEYSFKSGEQAEKGKIKLDPSKKPAEIDLIITEGNDKGKTQRGIWKLDGDTFTLCCSVAGDAARPKEFATKEGSDQLMFTFKKQKP